MQISLDDQNAHLAFGILDIWKIRAATPLAFGYLDICTIYHFKHRIWHLLFIMTISANFSFEISNKNQFFKWLWRLKCIYHFKHWDLAFTIYNDDIRNIFPDYVIGLNFNLCVSLFEIYWYICYIQQLCSLHNCLIHLNILETTFELLYFFIQPALFCQAVDWQK